MTPQKPNLLIDVTRVLRRRMAGRLPTGIDRVIESYVARHGDARLVVSIAGHAGVLGHAEGERVREWLAPGGDIPTGAARRLVARAMAGSWLAPHVAGSVLLNLGHHGLDHGGYAGTLRRAGCSLVSFLHDVIPLTHAEYCRPGEGERHARRVRHALRSSRAVIVNSEATAEELARVAVDRGWARPRTVVAPLAPALASAPAAAGPGVASPYFVMLGTLEPRKNHALLLQVWRRLVEQRGRDAPRLVIVGQRGWECENVVDMLERCRPLRGIVEERTRCGDGELARLLAGARALLFPSFVEGFGLPLVEALAMGVPVIASDLAVFREIAGDVPEYADPLEGPRWHALVNEYAQDDSELRAAQVARMPALRLPTWERHFEIVDELLAQCAAAPATRAPRWLPLRPRPVPTTP